MILTEIESIEKRNLLPEGWRWVALDKLFDVKQGVSMSPARRNGIALHPFLRTLNIH